MDINNQIKLLLHKKLKRNVELMIGLFYKHYKKYLFGDQSVSKRR